MNKRIHFIGIGGIGMSGIAQLCIRKGYVVSGSDMRESESTQKLGNLGTKIYIGHNSDNITDQDLIVYSSAISFDNPEIQEANKKHIPILKRAEFLASLMKDHTVIAVTGAHGKTTTSSLAAHLLIQANFNPTIAVGGILGNMQNNAELGSGKYFVIEADESDGTFLCYEPTYSIITNIDYEHMDYYHTFENVKKAFAEFILKTQNECVFWCYDDPYLRDLMKNISVNNISFGLSKNVNIYAQNIVLSPLSSQFDVFYNNKFLDRFNLSLAGRHNISNSLAVIALGLKLNIECDLIKKALNSFLGVKRRFQIKYNQDDILIVDDYGHHPSEIRATIEAARRLAKKRLVVIFQPHRYSRFQNLMGEFSSSFFEADSLFITDIYSAGEKKIEGVEAIDLYNLMQKFDKPKTYFVEKEMINTKMLDFIQEGDLVLFLGAGDINKVSDELVKRVERKVSIQ